MQLKLPTSPKDQIKLVIVVIAIALGVVYYMYVYSPKKEELVALTERLDQLDAANTKAKASVATGSVTRLKEDAAKSARDLEMMRQLVPAANEVPGLLEQVSTAARRVNLDIGTVQPEPVLNGELFDTYRYKLSVLGPYHALGEFLANVGSLPRIMQPINLKLSPMDNPAQKAKPGQRTLRADFQLQTYVAKPGGDNAKGAQP